MKYIPQNKEELQKLVNDESIYLGDIDTSLITDMSYLFEHSKRKDFSGIEKWDVGKVKDMKYMFDGAKSFNQPIGNWDVGSVWDMDGMFFGAESFNQDISNWDVRAEYKDNVFVGCVIDEKFKPKILQKTAINP